jgi:outer membrane protein assembly factor BamB
MHLRRLNPFTHFAVAGFAIALSGSIVAGQNWPQFRGPNAGGLGEGKPPVKWNVQTGEHIRWKVDTPGLGHSSPIVWGDRVYLTTAVSSATDEPELKTGWMGGSGTPADESGEWAYKVLCLSADDGRILWERTAHTGVPKVKRHPKASHANCTPATDGKHIVAFFGSEGLYCYDRDGELRWKKDLGLLDAGAFNAPDYQWGFASSPIIHENMVIVQCDANNTAFWAAFDIADGREIRRVERDEGPTWSTPAICRAAGRTQLICNGYRHMGGYDLATGESLWKMHGGGDVPVPTPLVAHDLIIITNGHGKKPLLVVKPGASGDVTPGEKDDATPEGLAWWRAARGSYMPTPIVVGDDLFVGDDNGILTIFDARGGEQRHRARLVEGSSATYSASPVAAGGHVYFTSEDGDIHVIKAADPYERVASNSMGEVCMATPAIAAGRLYVRGAKRLYCIAD